MNHALTLLNQEYQYVRLTAVYRWRTLSYAIATASLVLSACTKDSPSASTQIDLIQSTGGHCQYAITPTQVSTLNSVFSLTGKLGKVVTSPNDLGDMNILKRGLGFNDFDGQFGQSGDRYFALNYATLYGASLYQTLEATYQVWAQTDPRSDLSLNVTNLGDTLIVYRANINAGEFVTAQGSSDVVTNNAAYVAVPVSTDSRGVVLNRNYFFTFDTTDQIPGLPLGLNRGVIAHEATHFVSQYLWRKFTDPNNKAYDTMTTNTLGSIDEGMSDYGAFLVSKDPDFFSCSFGDESRNLSVAKVMSPDMAASMADANSNYDVHAGGAIWAAAQFQIGQAIGHDANARALVAMFANFPSCPGVGASQTITFAKLIQCHIQALGGNSAAAQRIYSAAFPTGSGS